MEYERYAGELIDVSDDVLGERKDFLKQSVAERLLLISLRKQTYETNRLEIGHEISEKEHRLKLLSLENSQERTTLIGGIDDLRSELRAERVGLLRDVSVLSRSLMETLEQYSEIAQFGEDKTSRRGVDLGWLERNS